MKASQGIKDFIKIKEGFRSKPYLDSVKIPTIGYGTIRYPSGNKVTMNDTEISEIYANEIFNTQFAEFEKDVNFLRGMAQLNQHQFDALCSFAYNLGANALGKSTLLKKLLVNPNDRSIRDEFMKWVNAGGKPIQGLVNRRKEEADWYFKVTI